MRRQRTAFRGSCCGLPLVVKEHSHGERGLLRDDTVPEDAELRVAGQPGDGGDVSVVEAHEPFDEAGAQPVSCSSWLGG